MNELSFITLLAFDYRYAPEAIRSYYDVADEIVLGIDAQRVSWAGQPYAIDLDRINACIREIDHGNKIRIVEGNFHGSDDPMVNDTAERSELSRQCRDGNWVVQIDSDEVLLNPPEFKQWMLTANPTALVGARWVSVFKTFGEQALVINPALEVTPVATRLRGQYVVARWTREKMSVSPLQLLHFSWGRTPDELKQKLANWSHQRDFDTTRFYQMWESVTLENYQEIKNFHPLNGALWPGLSIATLSRTV